MAADWVGRGWLVIGQGVDGYCLLLIGQGRGWLLIEQGGVAANYTGRGWLLIGKGDGGC